jgi:DNA-binding transcriptional MerR regulator
MKKPEKPVGLTVSQVARTAGVSVRALHHYDEIGLLRPSARSEASYRVYDRADLARLQQIMFFRALELPLEEVADNSEGTTTMTTKKEGTDSDLEQQGGTLFSAFKDFKPEDYEADAEQRWGHTDAYKESKARTARYREDDWKVIKAESGATLQRLADELAKGTPPDAPAAMDAAEAHRQHIERWFYSCPPIMHRGLGQLYVNDARFTANIDKIRPGLSAYAEKAFAANADRRDG